jgi:prepilin-type N-terminal cleavage/methylation domain-containing protein
MRRTTYLTARATSGFTLVEIMIASSVLVLILLAAFATITRDAELSRSTLGISVARSRCCSASRASSPTRAARTRARPRP